MSQEINRLSHEVEQLRQEQEYRPSVPPPQPPAQLRQEAKPEQPRPTVLIFRGKHVING